MTEKSDANRIQTTQTTVNIIETLMSLKGARVSELAEELDLPTSTAHRHLSTLEDLRYLTKEGDEYRLGFEFVRIGEYIKSRETYQLACEVVGELAEETGERAQFFIEEHGEIVYVCYEIGQHGVETRARIGQRRPLHATAGGKAMLAHFPEKKMESMITSNELRSLTQNTITDPGTLRDELHQVRELGYAINDEEARIGSRAVAVPLLDNLGGVIGSLSVTGPKMRMQGEKFEEDIPTLLLGAANELSLNILY